MKHIIRNIMIAVFLPLVLAGCYEEDKSDAGYSDGYAAGYNTTCAIRATLIEGDFENSSYAESYRLGYADGAYDCQNNR